MLQCLGLERVRHDLVTEEPQQREKGRFFSIHHEIFFLPLNSWVVWEEEGSSTLPLLLALCHRCLYCLRCSQTVLLQWIKMSLMYLLSLDASWPATASATNDEVKPVILVVLGWRAASGALSCDDCELLLWQGHISEAALYKWERTFSHTFELFCS